MVSWLIASVASANPYAAASPAASPVVVAPFTWSVPKRAVDTIEIVLSVPAGHQVYRDAVGVKAVRGTVGEVAYPEATLRPDLYDPGAWRASYDHDVVFRVPVQHVDDGLVELELTQQGCRAGLCWPIVVTRHTVAVSLSPPTKEP